MTLVKKAIYGFVLSYGILWGVILYADWNDPIVAVPLSGTVTRTFIESGSLIGRTKYHTIIRDTATNVSYDYVTANAQDASRYFEGLNTRIVISAQKSIAHSVFKKTDHELH